MSYHLSDSNQVEFSIGGLRDGVDVVYEAGALRELLKLGAEALRQVEARHAQAQAEYDAAASSELATAVERTA